MSRATLVRSVLKPAVFLAALIPAGRIVYGIFFGGLSAEPIREIQFRTGWWALTFLVITLSVSPLRRLSGWNDAIRFRRMLGLFGFFYAVLHLINYVAIDQFFAGDAIIEDILKRPWITIGFMALVLLVPLAATSTQGMIRRLGRRWGQLHRLVYVAAALGVVHFLWLVKLDTGEPTRFGLILVAVLTLRLRGIVRRAVKREPTQAGGINVVSGRPAGADA